MSENGKSTEFMMQFIDKLIVGLIGFASFAVIVVTIFVVLHKYQVLYEKQLEKLSEIPYNETYRYMAKANSIQFYKETTNVSEYKCLTACKVTSFLSNQFIIDNDDLIPIYDNNKVMLYSVKERIVIGADPKDNTDNKEDTDKKGDDVKPATVSMEYVEYK